MVVCELPGTRLPLQMKRVSARTTCPATMRAFCLRSNPPKHRQRARCGYRGRILRVSTIKLTIPGLASAIAMSPTVDRHVRHQHDDTTEKQDGAPQQRRYGAGSRQQTSQQNDAQNAERQPRIADEHLKQPAGDLAQDIHRAITPLGCRTTATAPSPTSRNAAPQKRVKKEAPRHATHRPSPLHETL